MRIGAARVATTLLATAAAVGTAVPAQAAGTGVASVSGSRVSYTAATGKTNNVEITRSGNTVTINDRVAVKAGKGCKKVKGDSTKVTCRTASAPTRLVISLRDRDDKLTNRTAIRMDLWGGSGRDTLTGGFATDRISGGTGTDFLYGRGGDDVLFGGSGNDMLYGQEGDDQLNGDSGHDYLTGDTPLALGADVFRGGTGMDSVNYEAYTRAITVDLDGRSRDDGAAGEHDTVGADVENVYGGSGSDVLTGNNAANVLAGYDGDDVVRGGGGNDLLSGDDGTDGVYGDGGDDRLVNDAYDTRTDSLDGGAHVAGDQCTRAEDLVVNCETFTV